MTIKQIQALLLFLGYYHGDVDGISGPQTVTAVTAFQEDFGSIQADGIPGKETQKALRHSVTYGMERTDHAGKDEAEETGTFWDEIKYFSRSEFACRCGEYHSPYCNGYPVEPDETLVRLADRVRAHFGRPAYRSSGIRCPQHNVDSGGVSTSKHKYGKALDFRIEGKTAAQVLAYVNQQLETNYAYDIDGTYVHMDVE